MARDRDDRRTPQAPDGSRAKPCAGRDRRGEALRANLRRRKRQQRLRERPTGRGDDGAE